MKWFNHCKNHKDVKAQMRKYRSIYHPDRNNNSAYSNQIMTEIQLEYRQVMKMKPESANDVLNLRAPWDNQMDDGWVQNARREFIKTQTLVCQSFLVTELFAKGIFQYEDIENYGETIEIQDVNGEYQKVSRKEYDEYLKWLTNAVETNHSLQRMLDHTELQDGQYPEIYEWWATDNYFADLLRSENECILDNDYGLWWGRTSYGQAIYMDAEIHRICAKIGWFAKFYPMKEAA